MSDTKVSFLTFALQAAYDQMKEMAASARSLAADYKREGLHDAYKHYTAIAKAHENDASALCYAASIAGITLSEDCPAVSFSALTNASVPDVEPVETSEAYKVRVYQMEEGYV